MATKYIDAIFRGGRIELLEPVPLAEGTCLKVLVENDSGSDTRSAANRQIDYVRQLRGAFKGSLSSSEEFAHRKTVEKTLER